MMYDLLPVFFIKTLLFQGKTCTNMYFLNVTVCYMN